MKRIEQVLQGKAENYILPFFWQHGEDESVLRDYMRAIYEANIRAVCVESRPHPDFVGETWWRDMDIILDEASQRDMKVWILDDSHFPTGFANGAVKTAPRELKHQYMVSRTLEMAGPVCAAEFDLNTYMQPQPLPPWIPQPPKDPSDDFSDDKLVRILACPILPGETLGQPLDLTACVQDDIVRFDLPEGYFRIYVVYLTRNARGRNDYINFMDQESCRLLIDAVYEPHYAHYAPYFGSVIAGFFSDEPPIGNTEGYNLVGPIGTPGQSLPWSRAAADRFTEFFGSADWSLYTPYLWADAEDTWMQAKVRTAYMDMVSTLVAECFSAQNGAWCEAHGIEYIGHMLEDCDMHVAMGPSMGHFFRGLSGQHMAGVDNIGGQVTIGGQNVPRHDTPNTLDEAGFYQYMIGKMAASHAAIDPKKRGRAMCENFGAYGWSSGPKEQKFMLDHYMARGVNYYVPHAFTPAPFPDPDCPPHFYAHGENPTYRAFGVLMAYANRVCSLINDGTPHPDVALLYNAESVWAGGGDSQIPVCRALGEAQIDFHIIPSDVFENNTYPCALQKDGLHVNGIVYKALLVSGCQAIDPISADMILKMRQQGFHVFFIDRRPELVIGAAAEDELRWNTQSKDLPVVPLQELAVRLKTVLQPESLILPQDPLMTTYHYELEGVSEWLVLNEHPGTTFAGTISLNGTGVPLRYDPWENRLEQVAYTVQDGRTLCGLSVDPLALVILLLLPDEAAAAALLPQMPHGALTPLCEIPQFTVGRIESKAYENKKEPDHLAVIQAPYTGMQILYPDFAGYYVYETEVESLPTAPLFLEADAAYECMEVFWNGQSLGTRVQAPYHFRIPMEIVHASNKLRIEVATLAERKVHAIAPDQIRSMSQERPLSATGLVGRVQILTETP